MIEVAALLDLGLPLGLLQAAAGKSDEERDEVFRRGVALALVAGALVGIGFAVYGFAVGGELGRALPFAGLLIAATIPASALESALVVKDRHLHASLAGGMTGRRGDNGMVSRNVGEPEGRYISARRGSGGFPSPRHGSPAWGDTACRKRSVAPGRARSRVVAPFT